MPDSAAAPALESTSELKLALSSLVGVAADCGCSLDATLASGFATAGSTMAPSSIFLKILVAGLLKAIFSRQFFRPMYHNTISKYYLMQMVMLVNTMNDLFRLVVVNENKSSNTLTHLTFIIELHRKVLL